MERKNIIIIFMILISHSIFGQSLNIKLNTLAGKFPGDFFENSDYTLGCIMGVLAEKNINKNWSLATGIEYGGIKTNIDVEENFIRTFGDITTEFISLPLRARYATSKDCKLLFGVNTLININSEFDGHKFDKIIPNMNAESNFGELLDVDKQIDKHLMSVLVFCGYEVSLCQKMWANIEFTYNLTNLYDLNKHSSHMFAMTCGLIYKLDWDKLSKVF